MMLNSIACRHDDFSLAWYTRQESRLRVREIFRGHSTEQHDFVNRKFWEWCAIAQVLEEHGRLVPGMSGLGFAVGTEPLSSFFAANGCQVLATDLAPDDSSSEWMATHMHAASVENLYFRQLIDRPAFDQRVRFQAADMRTLEGITGRFDFVWSSCALEHLGSLQAGIDFVLRSSRLLKPGGVAVHTTEVNVLSNIATIELGPSVVYRMRDLILLHDMLKLEGLVLRPLNFDFGDHAYDSEPDVVPYFSSGRRHIKLEMDGHVCTSFLLVIERPAAG